MLHRAKQSFLLAAIGANYCVILTCLQQVRYSMRQVYNSGKNCQESLLCTWIGNQKRGVQYADTRKQLWTCVLPYFENNYIQNAFKPVCLNLW